MAVGDHEVEATVQIGVEKAAAESQRAARRRADAGLDRHIFVQAAAGGPIQADHLVVEVRDRKARVAGIVEVAAIGPHAGAGLSFRAEREPGLDGDVLERAVSQIAIELVRLRVVGDEQIRPAVLIGVDHRHAERLRAGVEHAARRRHVLEGAVAAIAEQPAGVSPIGLRRAVRLLLAVEAAEHIVLRGPLDVIADEQVEQTVAVEIEPERGGAEAGAAGQTARARDVNERALAGIAKQPVLTDARDRGGPENRRC